MNSFVTRVRQFNGALYEILWSSSYGAMKTAADCFLHLQNSTSSQSRLTCHFRPFLLSRHFRLQRHILIIQSNSFPTASVNLHILRSSYAQSPFLVFASVCCKRRQYSQSLVSQYSCFCQNISLYEPEQSLSLSQDEGEQC